MSTVGVCGLGNMGLAVAERLAAAHDVVGFDREPVRRELAAAAGIATVTGLDGLVACRTVVLSLPMPSASTQTVDDLGAILASGSLVVETSTVTPHDVIDLGARAHAAGLDVVEAAILSGVQQMRDGVATLLVGGEPRLVDDARPLLEAFSGQVLVQGELGSGMATKIINNAVAHTVMVVLVEAFAMARATGVPTDNLVDLLASEDGGLIRPLTHRIIDRVLPGHFAGGMPLEAARKDSTLAMETAARAGVPLYAVPAAHLVYELGVGAGLGREDYAAIATLWKQLRPAVAAADLRTTPPV